MRCIAFGILFAVILVAAEDPVLAQRDGPEGTRTEATPVSNDALEDIARSLRQIAAYQRAILMIRRVELTSDRLSSVQDEARRARDDVRGRNEELDQFRAVRESVRRQLDEAVLQGRDPMSIPEREEIDQIDAMIGTKEAQLEDAEQRVLLWEDELARGQERVEILDDMLDELLGELGEVE